MKTIAVLGSTGSIGVNTLELADSLGGRFRVVGLAAGANTSLLAEQVKRFHPEIVSPHGYLVSESDIKRR